MESFKFSFSLLFVLPFLLLSFTSGPLIHVLLKHENFTKILDYEQKLDNSTLRRINESLAKSGRLINICVITVYQAGR